MHKPHLIQNESYIYQYHSIQAVICSHICSLLLLLDESIYSHLFTWGLYLLFLMKSLSQLCLNSKWSRRCQKWSLSQSNWILFSPHIFLLSYLQREPRKKILWLSSTVWLLPNVAYFIAIQTHLCKYDMIECEMSCKIE